MTMPIASNNDGILPIKAKYRQVTNNDSMAHDSDPTVNIKEDRNRTRPRISAVDISAK